MSKNGKSRLPAIIETLAAYPPPDGRTTARFPKAAQVLFPIKTGW